MQNQNEDKPSRRRSCFGLKDFAGLVLEWKKVDDEVAEHGWGGNRDERWDDARSAMISAAAEILGKESNP